MKNRSRIQTVSKFMQFACMAVALFVFAFQLYFMVMIRLNPDLVMPVVEARRTVMEIAGAGLLPYLLAVLLYTLPSLLMSYAIWHLSRMFRNFSRGEYFTEQSVSHLLLFSLLGFVTQLTASLLESLAGTASRIGAADNFISISISIDRESLVQLLAWGTFFVVAWILREGIQLAKENAEFI